MQVARQQKQQQWHYLAEMGILKCKIHCNIIKNLLRKNVCITFSCLPCQGKTSIRHRFLHVLLCIIVDISPPASPLLPPPPPSSEVKALIQLYKCFLQIQILVLSCPEGR